MELISASVYQAFLSPNDAVSVVSCTTVSIGWIVCLVHCNWWWLYSQRTLHYIPCKQMRNTLCTTRHHYYKQPREAECLHCLTTLYNAVF